MVSVHEEIVLRCLPEHLVRGRLEIDRFAFPVRDEKVAGEAALRFEHDFDGGPERALRQHVTTHERIGQAFAFPVLLALEMIGGNRDA